MKSKNQIDILNYLRSIKFRILGLGKLKQLVGDQAIQHLSENQWNLLENQLLLSQKSLLEKVKKIMQEARKQNYDSIERRKMYNRLGLIEIELAKSYGFFDTYLDVISQRTTSELGPILSGIDVIADHAIRKDLPRMKNVSSPIVYCDRGYGASILREGIPFPDGSRNPLPLIQIPYSRIQVKYLLGSLIHECGHETFSRTGLKSTLAKVCYDKLISAGKSNTIAQIYANWSSEIGPDFWAFCQCGYAQTAGIKEVLNLPSKRMFKISKLDPHPSPYIRTLLSISWCQKGFGSAEIWDRWKVEWKNSYPLPMDQNKRRLIIDIINSFPIINDILFNTKWEELGNKSFIDIFPLDEVSLEKLKIIGRLIKSEEIIESNINLPSVIGGFRYLIDHDSGTIDSLDIKITSWLKSLHKNKIKNNLKWQNQTRAPKPQKMRKVI